MTTAGTCHSTGGVQFRPAVRRRRADSDHRGLLAESPLQAGIQRNRGNTGKIAPPCVPVHRRSDCGRVGGARNRGVRRLASSRPPGMARHGGVDARQRGPGPADVVRPIHVLRVGHVYFRHAADVRPDGCDPDGRARWVGHVSAHDPSFSRSTAATVQQRRSRARDVDHGPGAAGDHGRADARVRGPHGIHSGRGPGGRRGTLSSRPAWWPSRLH